MAVLNMIWHRLEEGFLVAVLAAMTLITFLQVVLRYVFNTGILWGLEATTYLFGWLVLIGISYGVRVRSHIGIDLLVASLPPKLHRAAGLLVVALALLYTGFMFYGSWNYVARMHRLGVEAEDIAIERWVLGLCLPIGFGLLAIRLIEMGSRIATGRSAGYELADEAREVMDEAGVEMPPHGGPAR
jgi:C4-dicarboxylate transporter DctQ subunit